MTTVIGPGRRRVGRAAARGAALIGRAAGAAVLIAMLGTAAASPVMPVWIGAVAAIVLGLAAWTPALSFPLVVALAPFGALFAAVPIRATEMLVYAFFAGWLLRLRQPLDPADRRHGTIYWPALGFVAAVAASWLVVVAERFVGLAPGPLAIEIVRSLPLDYLVTAGRDPQTAAALQLILAIAILLAVPVLSGADPRLPRRVGYAVAAAGLTAAAGTLVDIPLRYVRTNFDPNILMRYLRGSRGSIHMADVNAAGSHYALSGLLALAFAREAHGGRAAWIVGLLLLAPAFGASGSRAAMVAVACALALAWAVSRGWFRREGPTALSRRAVAALAVMAVVAALASTAWLVARGRQANKGTAAWSMSLREQFLVTSARMFATAPVFGVGVGNYYERSGEFMPAQIKELYQGHENAHNYFAQVIVELGIVGGPLFLWLLGAAMLALWRTARAQTGYTFELAMFAACTAFLLTCVTGHPLLVVEAAVPFWALIGAGVAHAPLAGRERSAAARRSAIAIVVVLAVTLPLRVADRLYAGTANLQPRGLHDERRDESGELYRWTSDRAVLFVGKEPGLVVLPVRARRVPGLSQPFELEVAVSGQVEQRVRVPTDRWLPVTVLLRGDAPSQVRRIDLRVNQTWSAKGNFGDPTDGRPMGVMLGRVEYRPRPTSESRSAH